MRDPRIWRLAVAGNVAALLLLTLVFAQGPLLFTPRVTISPVVSAPPECVFPARSDPRYASRAVLIVVDALRLDSATDQQKMPTLTALARQGGFTVGVVESLIPSTVAAIQALVAGVIVPPLAFVEDFAAFASAHGGILEAVRDCGGQTFVAGPRLWTDLYGAWITDAVTSEGFTEDDERILAATIAALERNTHQLVVMHLSRPDHAAHQYGARSTEYEYAVRWCDRAIAHVLRHIDAATALVITADHGVTQAGGHAGLEPAVRMTPLVTWGPGFTPGLGTALPQVALPLLLRTALHLQTPSVPVPPPASQSWVSRAMIVVLLGVVVLCVHRVLSGLSLDAHRPPPDAWLNATVWITLLLSYCGAWPVACALGAGALIGAAWRTPRIRQSGLALAFGVGCVFGIARLIDGLIASGQENTRIGGTNTAPWGAVFIVGAPLLVIGARAIALQPTPRQLHAVHDWRCALSEERRWTHWVLVLGAAVVAYGVGGRGLVSVVIFTIGVGFLLGGWLLKPMPCAAVRVGIVAALIPAAGARLVGDTVSLSTIDVHVAFAVADSSFGLLGAIAVAVARQALVSLSFCLSLARALRTISPDNLGRFAAGFAGTCSAQALPAAVIMLVGDTVGAAHVSLALGAVLHVLNESIFCFLALAGGLCLRSRGSDKVRQRTG